MCAFVKHSRVVFCNVIVAYVIVLIVNIWLIRCFFSLLVLAVIDVFA